MSPLNKMKQQNDDSDVLHKVVLFMSLKNPNHVFEKDFGGFQTNFLAR